MPGRRGLQHNYIKLIINSFEFSSSCGGLQERKVVILAPGGCVVLNITIICLVSI